MVNFLVCGDIGAASNLVKNIILLSNDVYWPFAEPRLEKILKQYPERLKSNKQEWIFLESKIGNYKEYYGIDLSHELDWEQYEKNVRPADKPIVFINHSFVYDLDNFYSFLRKMPSLIVMPITDFGLEWQIRAYCEKKGVEIMHNFTFETDIEEQKTNFIKTYGLGAWCKENIKNLKCIVENRRNHIVKNIDQNHIIPLEWLIEGNDTSVVGKLQNYFDVHIDKKEAFNVLQTWRGLHWPLNDTLNWEYA